MGVGLDVVSVERVMAAIERSPRFVERVYTQREREACAGHPERWASTWAAKEAVRKLIGARGQQMPPLMSVEVIREPPSAPRVAVRGRAVRISVSLSHDAGVAAAVVSDADVTPPATPEQVQGVRLPDRPDDAHKGTFGRVVVVAGSRGFTGAPVLASMGAARGGAGLVTLCVPAAIHAIVATRCLEVMPTALDDDGQGVLLPDMLEALDEQLARADAVVLGPGLGRAHDTADAVVGILESLPCPAVVDADALNIVAERDHSWRAGDTPLLITPHPAEMARLAHLETAAVQGDRLATATSYARKHGVVVVLKGSNTVVAAPDGRVHVDEHRVVALATGGTGDVLAGLCGAMAAQGLDGFEAAVAAVTVHAEAGLRVQAVRGRAGALASDLLEELPAAQERLRVAIERSAR
jgi:NAD(P)H-hydrate epimerase